MKLILDQVVDEELKDYLLSQEGITDVNISIKDFVSELNIHFDQRITPQIIMRYIDLFQNNQFSVMMEFDKEIEGNLNMLKYTIDDMCCEYCYKGLVLDLFQNEFISSVKSNFDFHNVFNIEFFIEHDESYSQNKIIKYINEKWNA